ncbi:hypothetical protein [Alcaligenes phenolicus]|uniref:Uncharacterized protein n=1 Tax=Alcaligenes phenolicus TaxID=232846 RepID=A0AAW5VUA5_9BURK|nr:hypothetical protein [Alcaligenes phenolicus]MCX5563767.1 hypothetical protein [Alcaligenes phenolicus]
MDLLHQLIYLQEIQAQCRMALQAGNALNQTLALTEPMQSIEDGAMKTAEVFRNVHSMLTHVANISKLLWPGDSVKSKRRNERAQELRSLLELPDCGHPLGERSIRNDLDHFDERLDCWADQADGTPRDIWQDCIGSWDVPIKQFNAKRKSVMRHFEPELQTFRFQGKHWCVPEMIEKVKALKQKIDPVELQIRNTFNPTPRPVLSDRVRVLD